MEVWQIENHLTPSCNLALKTVDFSSVFINFVFILKFDLLYFG